MHTSKGRTVHAPAATAGFTLVELMVSFTVLLVVLLGFSRMLLSSRMASSTTHEATLAKEAARAMIEELQAARFDSIYERYNSDPADDPNGNGTGPGAAFDVRGLEAPPNDPDGRVGLILFPELNGELTENLNLPQYGWVDLDLNGDGDHTDANVSDTYTLLPVLVRVAWNGSGGPGSVEFRTLIANF